MLNMVEREHVILAEMCEQKLGLKSYEREFFIIACPLHNPPAFLVLCCITSMENVSSENFLIPIGGPEFLGRCN